MGKKVVDCDKENLRYLKSIFEKNEFDAFLRVESMENDEIVSEGERKWHERVVGCLDAMEKYGENHWWESKDKKVLGYYQMKEDVLLLPFDKFHEAIESLLGRPVWTHEFGLNREGLIKEAERAFNGNQDTVDQRLKSIKKSFQQLEDLGKPIIGITVD